MAPQALGSYSEPSFKNDAGKPTEHSFHGSHTSPGKGKGVTHVSGTISYLCLGPLKVMSSLCWMRPVVPLSD
jgi:hypothetical protein